jgi:hypothetical protein
MLGPPNIRELVAAHHAEAAAVQECNWQVDQDTIEAMEKYNRDTNGVFVIRTPPTVLPVPVVADNDAKAKWKPPANVRGDTRKKKPWER